MEKKKIWRNWKVWVGIITIILIVIGVGILVSKKENNDKSVSNIKIGDIVKLKKEDKILLREKTINCLKDYLKAPSTAQFQEEFTYNCTEPNIIEVKGYVDSQNSFGAMIRGNFACEYFAIGNLIDTLVYLKFNEQELFNIKDTYIEEYQKQEKLDEIKKAGNELNQEKLDYITDKFNNEKWNDVGKIVEAKFNNNETDIILKITAESSKKSKEDMEYWVNFNICSILHYFNEFDVTGIAKMNIYDIDNNKTVEVSFDNNFLKEKWKDNSQINLVKELFGENYKEF